MTQAKIQSENNLFGKVAQFLDCWAGAEPWPWPGNTNLSGLQAKYVPGVCTSLMLCISSYCSNASMLDIKQVTVSLP